MVRFGRLSGEGYCLFQHWCPPGPGQTADCCHLPPQQASYLWAVLPRESGSGTPENGAELQHWQECYVDNESRSLVRAIQLLARPSWEANLKN